MSTFYGTGAEKVYYSGYAFDPELVPSGMIPYEAGWSEGALFSSPTWILSQIDQNLTSSVLDRGVTPIPTEFAGYSEDFIAEGYAALEGGNYRTAYRAFQKAIEIKPSSPDAWYGAGISLENQRRYLSALDAYSHAITYGGSAGSNWTSYAGKGRVLYYLNRFAEAKEALETAILLYEKSGISYPSELEEITRLLDELNTKSLPDVYIPSSAYIPLLVTSE